VKLLDSIVASTRARLASLPTGAPPPPAERDRLAAALRGRTELSVVAEVKRRSPSRGAIAPEASPVEVATTYAECGASAISVLTEPDHFGGSLADLEEVVRAVHVPVLMKDFVVDPEQVRVAALLGASAFLVVLRITSPSLLTELSAAADEFGLTPVVEAHDEAELERALSVPGVVGLNNRNLETLSIDTSTVLRLAERVPEDRILLAESGYLTPGDLEELRGRTDGVLIGTALMESGDPGAFLREVASCV
jgi:indole-3-glycerol phosphate synthase